MSQELENVPEAIDYSEANQAVGLFFDKDNKNLVLSDGTTNITTSATELLKFLVKCSTSTESIEQKQ